MSVTSENFTAWCSQYNCHSIGICRKVKDGKRTKELSLTFFVEKKLPISSLDRLQIIPTTIGNYKTDVIEQESSTPLVCYQTSTGFNQNHPEHAQEAVRPLKGGVSIGNLYDKLVFGGTLGQLCIDQDDGTVVGLSNHHVFISQYEKNLKHPNPSTVEYLKYPDYRLQKYYNIYNKPITQPAVANPSARASHRQEMYKETSTSSSPSQWGLDYNDQGYDFKKFLNDHHIGYVKKFIQPSLFIEGEANPLHKVDAAVCSINNDSNIIPNSNATERSKCFGIRHMYDGIIPWATDEQMNTLREAFDNGEDIYVAKTGRTTGITGSGYQNGPCPVIITSVDHYINLKVISDTQRQTNRAMNHYGAYQYAGLINFEYEDSSYNTAPVHGGDSGSVLVTDYFSSSGTVIGLIFAGSSLTASAAPIDTVRSELNLDSPTVEDMQSPLKFSNRDDWKYVESDSSEQKIVIDGKTYWNIGTKPQDKS